MNNRAASAEYARQVTVASARASNVEQALVDAERRLEQLEEVVRQRGQTEAQALENLDQVVAEIYRLRGSLESLQFAVDDLQQSIAQGQLDQEARQLHDEARLRQIEQFLGVQPPPRPQLDQLLTPDSSGGDPLDPGEDPVELDPGEALNPDEVPSDVMGKLELALNHMESGRQGVARAILEQAIQDHKGAPEMPELRYRMAETWFNDGQWGKAVGKFQSVIDNHRKSEWAGWSMLRQGECFTEMGQAENAALFYEEVVRLYPKTEMAKEAQELLRR